MIKEKILKVLVLSILICYLLISCESTSEVEKIEIYGYSVGDTLTDEFRITKVFDFPFRYAVLIKDRRVEVSVINKNISGIRMDSITPKEHIAFIKMFSNMMNSAPKYYRGNTPYNLRVEGEGYFWKDKIGGTEIYLCRDTKKDTLISYLSIININVSDSLKNIYMPNIDTIDYEITDVE